MFSHVLLENFGPFSRLEWKAHHRINVVVGENNTGKTLLLKMLYCLARSVEEYSKRVESDRAPWNEVIAEKLFWVFQPGGGKLGELVRKGAKRLRVEVRLLSENYHFSYGKDTKTKVLEYSKLASVKPDLRSLFLPPKEVLTAFDAIAATRDNLEIFGFDDTYQDLIKALRQPTTKGKIQANLKRVQEELERLFDGEIKRENYDFIFKSGREKYWMSQTAEGIKKIGILTTLIRNRTLREGFILFMDEPELNLHPHGIVTLVNMLHELSQAGIQVYLATHNYFVIKQLEILARKHQESVSFCSLTKAEEGVDCSLSDLRDGMPPNAIVDASVELFERDVKLDMEL